MTCCFQMTGVSVSNEGDGLCIVHLQGGNDLVLALTSKRQDDRVGELVGTLCKLWHRCVYLDPNTRVYDALFKFKSRGGRFFFSRGKFFDWFLKQERLVRLVRGYLRVSPLTENFSFPDGSKFTFLKCSSEEENRPANS